MKWTTGLKRSKQPRKQRSYRIFAPLHAAGTLMSSHLSKDLREKMKTRSLRVRTGDTVKVLRGSNKGKTGKVEQVDTRNKKVYITGIERVKKDGSKSLVPISPHAIMITEIEGKDKRRTQ